MYQRHSSLSRGQELSLAGDAIKDLRALSVLEGLRRLDLRGNTGEDLRLLRALRQLVWLHVDGSGIEDLEPPDGPEGLTVEDRNDRAPPEASSQRTAQARRN